MLLYFGFADNWYHCIDSLASIFFFVFLFLTTFDFQNCFSWFGDGFDGGPGYPGGHPPPSAPPPPPSYEDAMGYKSAHHSAPSSSGSGPGFWTGAGLGALGGYLWGRNA